MKTDEFYKYSGRVDCTCDYVYCEVCNEFERRNFNKCPIHSNNIFAGIDFGSGDDNYTVTWTISLGDSDQPYYHLLKPATYFEKTPSQPLNIECPTCGQANCIEDLTIKYYPDSPEAEKYRQQGFGVKSKFKSIEEIEVLYGL